MLFFAKKRIKKNWSVAAAFLFQTTFWDWGGYSATFLITGTLILFYLELSISTDIEILYRSSRRLYGETHSELLVIFSCAPITGYIFGWQADGIFFSSFDTLVINVHFTYLFNILEPHFLIFFNSLLSCYYELLHIIYLLINTQWKMLMRLLEHRNKASAINVVECVTNLSIKMID